MNVKEETGCRVCGSEMENVVDLGKMYPSGFYKEELPDTKKVPLVLAKCKKCDLVQLRHTVSLDSMYRQYWYRSGLNKSMKSDLKDIVDSVMNIIKREDKITWMINTVTDIGCNDGTMLGYYPESFIKIGFDPALNLNPQNCDYFINNYFSSTHYPKDANKSDIVTSIAMFYDLPDPNTFVKDVIKILNNKGIWVIQLTDLYSMLKINAFDNICCEHLEYYTLNWLDKYFKKFGLEIFDSEYNKVNGGSLRVYVGFSKVRKVTIRHLVNLLRERIYFTNKNRFSNFIDKISYIRYKVYSFINVSKNHGFNTFLLGASTKGNTLLQVAGLSDKQIEYAAEVNSEKFGYKTIGSDIEIISEELALSKNPNIFLVLPWHFKDTFLSQDKFKEYLKNRGLLLFPMPNPVVVYMNKKGKIKEEKL